jgi:hypothetical protein
VEGRQILDSIILTHDLIHSLHSSKKPGMLIKLDLSKSFDNLNWNYILNIWLLLVSVKYGYNGFTLFSPRPYFLSWLMAPPPRPSPLLGYPSGRPPLSLPLYPDGRRLGKSYQGRSGDRKLERDFSPWKESPASHQQFVDENMLMASPTLKESLTIKQVLHDFSEASGMCVNEEKSNIFFFNTPQPIQMSPNRSPRVPT